MNEGMELKIKPQTGLKYKLKTRINLSNIIQLCESDLNKLINQIEDNPLFKKLVYPQNKENRVITLKRFPGTDITSNYYELNEQYFSEQSFLDIEQFVNAQKDVIDIIKKIGQDKFKEYFLFNINCLSKEEVASNCGLSLDEVTKIINFVNNLAIRNEFYESSLKFNKHSTNVISYNRIASIEIENNSFVINFYSPNIAKGKYIIDYNKLEKLKQIGIYSISEINEINRLINYLELINIRKSLIYQILSKITEIQSNYLLSNDINDLVPFTQSDLARTLKVNPSLISRTIYARSILIPNKTEKPIEYFLPNNKKIVKNLVNEILFSETDNLTDEQLRIIIKEKYNKEVSRRTITQYRNELKIPSSFKRERSK